MIGPSVRLPILALLLFSGRAGAGPGSLDLLIGKKPPEWKVTDWMHSEPLQLKELAGKVVLVRWWTAPHCPYCVKSAPALNEWHSSYESKGLVVLGFFHPKTTGPLRPEEVEAHAKRLGFKFPVAIDQDLATLKQWWLEAVPGTTWTSVSFLIDRAGVIRSVHPGGQYVKGDAGYKALKAKIEELLNEK